MGEVFNDLVLLTLVHTNKDSYAIIIIIIIIIVIIITIIIIIIIIIVGERSERDTIRGVPI